MKRNLIALMILVPAAVQAEGRMMVDNAWSRAALADRTGVVYLSMMAMGGADRLLSAQTPIAEKVELHESFQSEGISRMRPVEAIPIAAGATVTLAPGGLHMMLIGLHQALKPGDSFPLALRFEKAGTVETTVKVGNGGGMGMKMD